MRVGQASRDGPGGRSHPGDERADRGAQQKSASFLQRLIDVLPMLAKHNMTYLRLRQAESCSNFLLLGEFGTVDFSDETN